MGSHPESIVVKTRADCLGGSDGIGGVIGFLSDLVKLRTDGTGDPLAAVRRVRDEFVALGLPSETMFSERADGSEVPTVFGWIGPQTTTPDLLLNAHVDTAPEGEGWTVDPYAGVVKDGRIFGRGVFTKADVAVFMHAAAAALQNCEGRPGASVAIAITSDEGDGGDHGVRHLLVERGFRPVRVLCNGVSHSITIAHCGCVQAKIRVRGTGCHQAVVDPRTETTRLAVALAHRIEERGNALRRAHSGIRGIASPTLNITRICSGVAFGMAPVAAELWVDRRTTPDEDVESCAADLRELVDTFAKQSGVSVDFELVRKAEPLRPSPEQAAWAAIVQCVARAVLKTDVPLIGLPIYTDARWFGMRGIPTVMYGAGGSDLAAICTNGPNENVGLADIETAIGVVTRVVAGVLTQDGQTLQ
jgi:succinyl-diaminopimelate desuccinylase